MNRAFASPSLNLEQCVSEYYAPLLSFIRRRIAIFADAEDLVQETYARSIPAIVSGKVGDVRAYLHRVARNLMTEVAQEPRVVAEIAIDPEELAELSDTRMQIEARATQRQELDRIGSAIQALPERSRTIFLLARMEDLSYAEIGRRLGITRQTVHEHMVRAMLALRAAADALPVSATE